MSENAFEEVDLQTLIPLEERILAFIEDKVAFSVQDLKEIFPTEPEKNIYRAVNRLENQSKIRFLRYQNKRKLYTTFNVVKLPTIKAGTERKTIKYIFDNIELLYPNGQYQMAQSLNNLPLCYARLFLVAQIEDIKERKTAFLALHKELLEHRANLMIMLENLDSIIQHPVMSGNLEYFSSVLTGSEAPTPPEVTAFKVWYRKFMEGKAE